MVIFKIRENVDLAEISNFPVPFFKTDGKSAPKVAWPISEKTTERSGEKTTLLLGFARKCRYQKIDLAEIFKVQVPFFVKSSFLYQKVMKSVVIPDFPRFTNKKLDICNMFMISVNDKPSIPVASYSSNKKSRELI